MSRNICYEYIKCALDLFDVILCELLSYSQHESHEKVPVCTTNYEEREDFVVFL